MESRFILLALNYRYFRFAIMLGWGRSSVWMDQPTYPRCTQRPPTCADSVPIVSPARDHAPRPMPRFVPSMSSAPATSTPTSGSASMSLYFSKQQVNERMLQPYVSCVSNVCFIWKLYVFYLDITKVDLVLHMLQWLHTYFLRSKL
jgi:hypothetical protein